MQHAPGLVHRIHANGLGSDLGGPEIEGLVCAAERYQPRDGIAGLVLEGAEGGVADVASVIVERVTSRVVTWSGKGEVRTERECTNDVAILEPRRRAISMARRGLSGWSCIQTGASVTWTADRGSSGGGTPCRCSLASAAVRPTS
ncbi:MAG: hypothetical protein R3F05_09755 [Planctomycetota bacterium]